MNFINELYKFWLHFVQRQFRICDSITGKPKILTFKIFSRTANDNKAYHKKYLNLSYHSKKDEKAQTIHNVLIFKFYNCVLSYLKLWGEYF